MPQSLEFFSLTQQQHDFLAIETSRSKGTIYFLVDPLEAIEYYMEPGQLEEMSRQERATCSMLGETDIPVVIFDERWRIERDRGDFASTQVQRRAQRRVIPITFIEELGLHPVAVQTEEPDESWQVIIDQLKSLGVKRILLGGRFYSEVRGQPEGGCVADVYYKLAPHFATSIVRDLVAKI